MTKALNRAPIASMPAVAYLLVVASMMIGCTNEKIVYRSGTNFTAPPTAAKNFIGYYDVANKQTVCGSCHVDYQRRWVETKHARAWGDLQGSGFAVGTCEACHSVSDRGNAAIDTAVGYRSAKVSRYYDVQCENCHGAGFTHASRPNSSNRPLVSIRVDTGLKNGCGECHTGTHSPFVDEWRLANAAGLSHSHIQAGAKSSTDPTCKNCHSAQGALKAFGVTENYLQRDSTEWLPNVCATCHDPHGSDNTHQLRFPISTTDVDQNLCMKCHQRRADPSQVTTRNSVHSPEGPTLVGLAGWFPPGMSASDSIFGTHASTDKNPRLCAGCHVYRYTATDKATGNFTFQSTGHRFIAVPCVDATGQPLVNQTCADSVKTFRTCVNSGCHGSEVAARSAFNTAELRTTTLETTLSGLITQAKAGPKSAECSFPNPIYSTCNGAAFNLSLSQKEASFVHNPFLIEQLLLASINQMKTDYNLPLAANVNLTPMFRKGVMLGEGGR